VQLLKIAVRSTRRNTRRTIITIITIVIGVVVIVMARGLIKGLQKEIIGNVLETRTGDIQIHRVGYRETLDILPLHLVVAFDEVLGEVSGIRGIQEISGRILFSGHLTTEEESAVLIGKAIDVEKELRICPRLADNVDIGEFLSPEDGNHVVLTEDLYTTLNAKVGDTFTLFATSMEGAINATELIVKGMIRSDLPDSRKRLGYIPLRTAQDLLLMDGIVTEIVVKADEDRSIDEVAGVIKAGLSRQGLEVNTWKEIEHNIRRMLSNHDFMSAVVTSILFIIVFSTVMNTMLMIVLERTREIGTLTAIGFRWRQVSSLFVLEGAVKGLMGGVVGVALGATLVAVLNSTGIPFRLPGGGGATYVIRPEIDPGTIGLALAFSVGAAVLASLYPAHRASRMHPAQALRSV
jgi:putative ABC transport system permease protein